MAANCSYISALQMRADECASSWSFGESERAHSIANTYDAKRAAQSRHGAAVPLELNVGSVAAGPAAKYRLTTEYPITA
jgi:hypothetical protein